MALYILCFVFILYKLLYKEGQGGKEICRRPQQSLSLSLSQIYIYIFFTNIHIIEGTHARDLLFPSLLFCSVLKRGPMPCNEKGLPPFSFFLALMSLLFSFYNKNPCSTFSLKITVFLPMLFLPHVILVIRNVHTRLYNFLYSLATC